MRLGRVSIHTRLELRWYVNDMDSEDCVCVMRTAVQPQGQEKR